MKLMNAAISALLISSVGIAALAANQATPVNSNSSKSTPVKTTKKMVSKKTLVQRHNLSRRVK